MVGCVAGFGRGAIANSGNGNEPQRAHIRIERHRKQKGVHEGITAKAGNTGTEGPWHTIPEWSTMEWLGQGWQ